jgi:Uma2 family endonuclease
MTTHTSKITVDEFWAMAGDPGHRYELVDGELVDMDGTPQDSVVSNQFGRLLGNHVAETGLPLHVGNSGGFQMDRHILRFPDVHVTSWKRMAAYDQEEGAWPRFAPNVAIEVVSASNTPASLARKTSEYFANGTQAVWIVDPVPRTVVIRRPGMSELVFRVGDILSGEPEIPGFTCPVADIFAVLDQFAGRASA